MWLSHTQLVLSGGYYVNASLPAGTITGDRENMTSVRKLPPARFCSGRFRRLLRFVVVCVDFVSSVVPGWWTPCVLLV
jgi:hypothetical protein